MPDATRPSRSMYWKAALSLLSFDGSLRRITSHSGGKNLNIVFAYATSLAYDRAMHTKGLVGVTGLDVLKEFQNEWISPRLWLEEMGWGGSNFSFTESLVTMMFNSFMQDEVLLRQGEGSAVTYRYIQELDYPSDEQLETARNSNKYFMMAMEDLINQLPHTLEHGKPQASRSSTTWLPLWEALLADPLVDIFREEMLLQTSNNLPQLNKKQHSLNIVEMGTGTGMATERLIPLIIEKYSDIEVNIHCYEDISNLLKRAKERIERVDNEYKDRYKEKGLKFTYSFTTKRYKDPISRSENSIQLVLSFQNLHYLNTGDHFNYFENISRLLSENGICVTAQMTSYSEDFPHPLTLAYMSVEGFEGYPTVEKMKEVTETFFKSVKSSAIDGIWLMKKPKFS